MGGGGTGGIYYLHSGIITIRNDIPPTRNEELGGEPEREEKLIAYEMG